MTILIVDDNPGMRRILRMALARTADTVHECSDGSDALAAYNTFHPDVVLMDIRMQIVDGLTATRQIVGYDPSACVVIVTDFDDDHLRAAAANAGARGYLLKEDMTALAKLVATVAGPSAA